MKAHPKDVRCKSCGILLAKIDDAGLTIRRGSLEATIDGEFHASLVCYRSSCRKLNVVRLSTSPHSTGAAA